MDPPSALMKGVSGVGGASSRTMKSDKLPASGGDPAAEAEKPTARIAKAVATNIENFGKADIGRVVMIQFQIKSSRGVEGPLGNNGARIRMGPGPNSLSRLALALVIATALAMPLTACGKRGAPEPPADKPSTYPKAYPSR